MDEIRPEGLQALDAVGLLLLLGRVAADCEAAGMRLSTSESEAMVLIQKSMWSAPCGSGVSGCPEWRRFKYPGLLFTAIFVIPQ